MFENFAFPQIPYGGYGRTLADLLTTFPAGVSKPGFAKDGSPRVGIEQASRVGEDVYRAYGAETGRDENFPHFAGRGV